VLCVCCVCAVCGLVCGPPPSLWVVRWRSELHIGCLLSIVGGGWEEGHGGGTKEGGGGLGGWLGGEGMFGLHVRVKKLVE
jgi:hypothetical protein